MEYFPTSQFGTSYLTFPNKHTPTANPLRHMSYCNNNCSIHTHTYADTVLKTVKGNLLCFFLAQVELSSSCCRKLSWKVDIALRLWSIANMTPGLQFPATEHHHTLAKIKLYCLVTEIDVWATWPVVTVSITWSRQSWSNREHNGANRSECFAAADEKNTLVMIKRSIVVLHCCNRFEANVKQRITTYFTLLFWTTDTV